MTNLTTVYPCCAHCDHDSPWGGSTTLTEGGHTVKCFACFLGPVRMRCRVNSEPHSREECLAHEGERSEG